MSDIWFETFELNSSPSFAPSINLMRQLPRHQASFSSPNEYLHQRSRTKILINAYSLSRQIQVLVLKHCLTGTITGRLLLQLCTVLSDRTQHVCYRPRLLIRLKAQKWTMSHADYEQQFYGIPFLLFLMEILKGQED